MVVGVLALQGDFEAHRKALAEAGASPTLVRTAAQMEEVDGLVIPGGESSVMDKLARTFGLAEPLRKAIGDGLPGYGTCAGMIMLADRILDGIDGQQTLGGLDIEVRRNAFGPQVESFEVDLDDRDGAFVGLGTRDDRGVAADRSRFLEQLQAAQACRFGKADLARECAVGDARVEPQLVEDAPVNCVELHMESLVY